MSVHIFRFFLLVVTLGLALPAAHATVTNYNLRMLISDTGDFLSGQIDSEDISVGDVYDVLFAIDDSAQRTGGIGIAVFEGALTNLQFLRDPSNTGTYEPDWDSYSGSVTLYGNAGVTFISFVADITNGNEIHYSNIFGSGTAPFTQFQAQFSTATGFDDLLPVGTPLSTYLAAYATPVTGWTPIVGQLTFQGEDTIMATSSGSDLEFVTIPEPSTWALMVAGLVGIAALRRKSRA